MMLIMTTLELMLSNVSVLMVRTTRIW